MGVAAGTDGYFQQKARLSGPAILATPDGIKKIAVVPSTAHMIRRSCALLILPLSNTEIPAFFEKDAL
jgi:hypothetical protein